MHHRRWLVGALVVCAAASVVNLAAGNWPGAAISSALVAVIAGLLHDR